ncbi:MAG: methyltransferase domain-containing protein [Candidatus Nanopelagicales bacterium]
MPAEPSGNPTSRWSSDRYATHGRFVADHAGPILDLLSPQPGERILDVGCGDGVLTEAIARTGADVVGIDNSPELVLAARERGVEVLLGDAAEMTYRSEFDAVFSNAALHWMLEPAPVANAMLAALRPGGRLAVEFGGFGNIAAIRTALTAVMGQHGFADADPGQYYPTADAYATVLERAGFHDISATIVPRQTRLPGHLADWLTTFRQGFLDAAGVPVAEQDTIVAETCELAAPALYDADSDTWYADYVRLRATARRPL